MNFLTVCEGPFNVWSLSQWGKSAVAFLGTGTESQYKQLASMKCKGYLLCLDPDTPGRKATLRVGNYLARRHKLIYVVDMPDGRDVNDLSQEEYMNVPVLEYNDWRQKYSYLFK